ncbi:MAG: aldose 1-epimerase [Saprospiraceae bacterium]|nr:aldose 1-epimerase [Saprospiraceae bacterium]
MFKLDKDLFGTFEQLHLHSNDEKNALKVIPGHGACLLDLTLGGVSILDSYKTPGEMDLNNWCKSRFLFPFPNRLKHGTYHWEDQIYQFPVNDGQTGNALHGLGMDKEFRYTHLDLKEDTATIECTYKGDGQDPAYPFRFSFVVRFTLNKEDEFSLEMSFQNLHSSPIPAGMGWHPYFKLDDEGVNRLQLGFPPCEMIGIDPYMIPTGKRYAYDRFEKKRTIQAEVLDNCFLLSNPGQKAELVLNNDQHQLTYWQEAGLHKFNYVQVFTPPHRASIAIEPMTCNIDAFNNGDGLVKLHPGEKIQASCGLKIEKTT